MNFSTSLRIFIVDDDPFWTAILHSYLCELGYSDISHFENGQLCLNALGENPDLIFLDYEMSGLTGLQVLDQIRIRFPQKGVILFTGHESLGLAIQALRRGTSDHLLKRNCTVHDVKVAIQNLMAKQVLVEKVY